MIFSSHNLLITRLIRLHYSSIKYDSIVHHELFPSFLYQPLPNSWRILVTLFNNFHLYSWLWSYSLLLCFIFLLSFLFHPLFFFSYILDNAVNTTIIFKHLLVVTSTLSWGPCSNVATHINVNLSFLLLL